MPNHATGRIQPQTLELPEAAVPQVKAFLVSVHLAFDDLEVDGRSNLCGWRESGQVAPHPAENPSLELEEVGVDAHPVARVFPPGGPGVLTLERWEWPRAAGGRPAGRTSRARFLTLPQSRPESFQITDQIPR